TGAAGSITNGCAYRPRVARWRVPRDRGTDPPAHAAAAREPFIVRVWDAGSGRGIAVAAGVAAGDPYPAHRFGHRIRRAGRERLAAQACAAFPEPLSAADSRRARLLIAVTLAANSQDFTLGAQTIAALFQLVPDTATTKLAVRAITPALTGPSRRGEGAVAD